MESMAFLKVKGDLGGFVFQGGCVFCFPLAGVSRVFLRKVFWDFPKAFFSFPKVFWVCLRLVGLI